MKTKIFIAILIIFLISACGGTKKVTDPEEIIKDIFQGTEGLTMSFMKGAPPDEVYEGSPFQLNLELENKGAYDIQDGWISIGLEQDYMRTNRWRNEDFLTNMGEDKAKIRLLKGKSQLYPRGDKRIASLTIDALKIKEGMSEKHESIILATACYKYQTKAIQTICIDTDIHNFMAKEKVCEVKNVKLTDQGAPLAVVEIEENMLADEFGTTVKPEIIIHIENKGNGQVVKDSPDTIDKACSADPLSYENLNLVAVSAFFPGKDNNNKKELNCGIITEEKTEYIKLKDNEGFARCILEEGISLEEGTFLSPLTIILDYGYTFTIPQEITINKIITY